MLCIFQPVNALEFPAVTICGFNRLNDTAVDEGTFIYIYIYI